MQIPYRVNLSAKGFPLLSSDMARTVILPGYDQNFNRQVVSRADADKDIGIPQLYFLNNILPTERGFSSVRTKSIATAFDLTRHKFDQVIQVGIPTFAGYLLFSVDSASYPNKIKPYSFIAPQASLNAVVTAYAEIDYALGGVDGRVSSAIINGTCYFWTGASSAGNPVFYTFDGTVITAVPIADLFGFAATISSIAASNGYLLAFSGTTVFWSSPTNPTSFAASLATGAGSFNVQSVKGNIARGIGNRDGLVLFCSKNIVWGAYTGNSRYPFVFKEAYNSGGIASQYDVADNSITSDGQYALTEDGLVLIQNGRADIAFPDLQSFFINSVREESANGIVVATTTNQPMNRRISYVSNRYLCISYGWSSDSLLLSGVVLFPIYSYILIYDTILQRWGKVKFDHCEVFSVDQTQVIPGSNVTRPYQSLGVIDGLGNITILKLDDPSATPLQAFAMFGKYQLSRTIMTRLMQVEIENIGDVNNAPSVYDVYSMDGKNVIYEQLTPTVNQGGLLVLPADREAKNHSILITGSQPINLNSIELTFAKGGRL